MITPNAEQIETAVDQMPKLDPTIRREQQNELHEAMGDATLSKLGSGFPLTDDFSIGYALGLQTARVVLAGSVALITKGIDPTEVL